MPLTDIEQLLTRAIGLDASSLGRTATLRAVEERQRACGIDDSRAYLTLVRTSSEELQALIETVVVSETWFFRDPAAFAALGREAAARYRALPAGRRLRLLSIPCSTGEEPYSMAITLLEAGVPAEGFHIDAIDVSHRALALARQGAYRRNSFRGAQSARHARYFTPTAAGFRIADRLRDLVTFNRGNLLQPSGLLAAEPYDVVFCRNVLIYFDAPSQDRAVANLARLIGEAGLVYVGAAELPVVRRRGCMTPEGGHAVRVCRATPRRSATRTVRVAPAATRLSSRPASSPAIAKSPPPPPMAATLADAVRLADADQFAEAAEICERHVLEHGPSARAFHLLGLVRDAVGNHAAAAESYRKALYLDPQNEETLIHLALLLELDNAPAEAARLRNRARRVALAAGAQS